MGMALPMGGHLTHGWTVSVTGKWFNAGAATACAARPAASTSTRCATSPCAERPKLIFCGGTAIPRTIDFAGFAEIAREVGAILVADIAHIAGLVAGGAHPSPVGHADVITTTTHKTLRGPRGAMIMTTAEHAKAIDKAVFPGLQGGPHNHTTAGDRGRAARGGRSRRSATYAAPDRRERARRWPTALVERGFDLVSGGTDNHLILVDLTGKGIAGKPAAQALDRAGHRAQLQHRAVRPAQAVRPVGHPPRHAGAHHARPDRGAHAAGRGVDGRRGRRRRSRTTRRRSQRIAGEVSDLLAGFPMPGYATA